MHHGRTMLPMAMRPDDSLFCCVLWRGDLSSLSLFPLLFSPLTLSVLVPTPISPFRW